MKLIQFSPLEYARQVALVFLAAPAHSLDEQALSAAYEEACRRIGRDPDEFLTELTKSVNAEIVEPAYAEGANAPGGAA